ncbi:MAG: hypothetical protein IGS39_25235 [Calothrix sp. C42_A2020_038]|nr:hypothetical protein [Calothrix sp. C42_A2020_038]
MKHPVIKYKPKLPARQSHILIHWGDNSARFLEIFDAYGVVQLLQTILSKLLKTAPSKHPDIFLEDKQDTNISSRKNDEAPQFLGDNSNTTNISPRKSEETPELLKASQNCHSERSEESLISRYVGQS